METERFKEFMRDYTDPLQNEPIGIHEPLGCIIELDKLMRESSHREE